MAAAAGLAGLGARGAAACGRVGADCDRDRDCCDGAECERGNCRCREGLSNCDGRCRDLKRDDDDCGRCGNRCRDDERCDLGRCRNPRDSERDRCLSVCVRGCVGLPQSCYNRCYYECRDPERFR